MIHHVIFASQLGTGINGKRAIRNNFLTFGQTVRNDIAVA